VRQIVAKALVVSLAVIIATILIAPQVDLDPVAPRLEWAACLLIVFLTWLAGMAGISSTGTNLSKPDGASVAPTPGRPHHCSCTAELPLLRC
jgi:hypothetical protein